jgi:heme exporter protein B
VALADVGLAVIGTLVSAIAIHTRARDLVGPLVGLPLLIPALIATARAAGPLLSAHGGGSPPAKWLAILALYDLVFGLVAYAVFDFLLED